MFFFTWNCVANFYDFVKKEMFCAATKIKTSILHIFSWLNIVSEYYTGGLLVYINKVIKSYKYILEQELALLFIWGLMAAIQRDIVPACVVYFYAFQ